MSAAPPRLPTACGALPPEGAAPPWGGPAAGLVAASPVADFGPPAPKVDATPALLTDPAWQLFMAFDYGLRRTGVASGNRITRSATPQATIALEGAARFDEIGRRLREWQPQALVVGVPYHPDGAAHENTLRAQKFARQLRGRFGLPVFEVDERYSTTEAHALGAKDADAASACIILEQFLRSLP